MKMVALVYNNKVTNDFILNLKRRGATNGVGKRNPIRSKEIEMPSSPPF
jgi:hypothetical protein